MFTTSYQAYRTAENVFARREICSNARVSVFISVFPLLLLFGVNNNFSLPRSDRVWLDHENSIMDAVLWRGPYGYITFHPTPLFRQNMSVQRDLGLVRPRHLPFGRITSIYSFRDFMEITTETVSDFIEFVFRGLFKTSSDMLCGTRVCPV